LPFQKIFNLKQLNAQVVVLITVVLHIVGKADILFVMMELKALAVLADKN